MMGCLMLSGGNSGKWSWPGMRLLGREERIVMLMSRKVGVALYVSLILVLVSFSHQADNF